MTEKAVYAMAYAMMGLAALAGGVIQPLTGFGAAVIMMVAASAFYDMTIAPTIVALICMAQSGTMTWMYRKHIDVKQIALPIGLYTVCSLVIINLLGNFDLHVLTALFGAFLIALAAYFLLFAKRVKLDQPGLAAGLVCSAFSGCCAGAFTIGGPMMALYFVAIARSKETYVGNMQFLFFTTNLINFTMRTVRGYFSAALLPMAGLGMACILLGLWIGTRLSRKMSGDVARQVVYIGVGVSGLVTLVQELMKADHKRSGAPRRFFFAYFRRSVSTTLSSQCPSNCSMQPSSVSLASAGSMGIFASRGIWYSFAASSVLPSPKM